MNKSIVNKILLIIVTIFILINFIPTFSKASFLDKIFSDGKSFIQTNTNSINQTLLPNEGKIKDVSSNIYNTLLTIAIVLSAIIITVLGIQFITGSIEQKAKVKEQLMPFIIGCVVVFGSFGIWKIVVDILSKI